MTDNEGEIEIMIQDKPFARITCENDALDTAIAQAAIAQNAMWVPPRPSSLMNVCAVIPAYNEERTIGEVVRETQKYVDKVFVINDGSTDCTAEVARQSGAEVIHHSMNRGAGASFQTGCDAAIVNGFDFMVQVDADRQHDPAYIPQMLQTIRGCDMVIASRFLSSSHNKCPFIRRLGISFFTRVVNLLTKAKITDVTSGYRMFRTASLEKLASVPDRHWAVAQTMNAATKGLRIKEVPVKMPIRTEGKSQFSLKVYCLYPLRMASIVLRFSLIK